MIRNVFIVQANDMDISIDEDNAFINDLIFATKSGMLHWSAIQAPIFLIPSQDIHISMCFIASNNDLNIYTYQYRETKYDGYNDSLYSIEKIHLTCTRYDIPFFELKDTQSLEYLFHLIMKTNTPSFNRYNPYM